VHRSTYQVRTADVRPVLALSPPCRRTADHITAEKGTASRWTDFGGAGQPASFEILVRDPRTEQAVAERFFNDPIVDNSPGQHDGVVYQTSQVP
jgi:hypothetical protein